MSRYILRTCNIVAVCVLTSSECTTWNMTLKYRPSVYLVGHLWPGCPWMLNFHFTRGRIWLSGTVVACICLFVCACLCVCASASHQIDQRCKPPLLRSLLFWLILIFMVKFNLKVNISLCPVSPSQIYNPKHQSNSHGYLDCFTVPTVPQSPNSAPSYTPRLLHSPNFLTVSSLRT